MVEFTTQAVMNNTGIFTVSATRVVDSTFASSLLMRWFFASRVSIITRLVVAIVDFFQTIFAPPPLHSITTRVITVLKMFGLCQ